NPPTEEQLALARSQAPRYTYITSAPRRVGIQSLLNHPSSLEERIVRWAIEEDIPIDKLDKDSFKDIFRPYNTPPNSEELRSCYQRLQS
ncbi:hypothetical protein L0F63_002818, partial [Massospora cicadina]